MPDWTYHALQGAAALAGQAVVLPLLAAVALLLLVTGRRQGALAWVAAVSATLVVMLVLKLVVFTLAPPRAFEPWMQSPSGHVASGIVVYGGIVALLCPPGPRRWLLPTLAAIGLALILGVARIIAGYHTALDVAIGAIVGLAGLALFLRLLRPDRARAAPLPLLALIAAVAISFAGMRLEAETTIEAIGADLRTLIDKK